MLLAPAFLLGLLAIGLPLWLHRFARQTQERRRFASLMLLERSEIQRSHRHTLRYLLLLALRIGLLLLLVLAFAEPVLPFRTAPEDAQDATLNVIVLDTSYSMRQADHWERAQERARQIIDSLGPADRAMLVAADHRIRIVHSPVDREDSQELRSALASTEPGLARLDYGMLMTSAESWIGTEPLATRLHLITDLQQSASPLRFADLEPPAGVELRLVDVGEPETRNVYISDVRQAAQDANALEVRVAGIPATDAQHEIILSIDGTERARRPVARLANGTARMSFAGLDLTEGDHRVVAMLTPSDTLPEDDQFHAVLARSDPRVLIVAGSNAADDAAYLAAAVGALTSPRLGVDRATPDALAERRLADHAALIVSDAGILSGASAGAVTRYLEGGGAVLMTLGPRAAALQSIPLSGHAPAARRLGAQAGGDAPGRVSVLEDSHPVLRDAQGWRSIRFFRHVPIEPGPQDNVLIRFEEGPPLLLERTVGAGRLLVFTSPLDREWNDLAIHPLFVRFIGEAARYLTGADDAASRARAGQVVTAGRLGASGAQVFDPRGQRVLNLGDTANVTRLVPDQLGFYEVRGGGRVEWIAVNVDSRESAVERMPPESIERWQSLRAPASPGVRAPDQVADQGTQLRPLWLWFLLAAATLAFVEPLMANSYLHIRRGVPS